MRLIQPQAPDCGDLALAVMLASNATAVMCQMETGTTPDSDEGIKFINEYYNCQQGPCEVQGQQQAFLMMLLAKQQLNMEMMTGMFNWLAPRIPILGMMCQQTERAIAQRQAEFLKQMQVTGH